jgi:hypothetical protein
MTQRKNEKKEYWKMTDGIGRIFGGNNYGVGGYVPQQKNDETKNEVAQAPVQNYEETQVDPSKVMDFMAANNLFVAPAKTDAVGELDAATQERVVGYMENFEAIYDVIVKEFGEENAPMVMDLVMDKLMGLAA